MIAFEILDAVTAYRSFGRSSERCHFSPLLSSWSRCNATDTLVELLARPAQAALRSRVRDMGELIFIHGGLPEMHRILQQVATIAPDTISANLISQWWKGVGANGLYWTDRAGSAPPDRPNSGVSINATFLY